MSIRLRPVVPVVAIALGLASFAPAAAVAQDANEGGSIQRWPDGDGLGGGGTAAARVAIAREARSSAAAERIAPQPVERPMPVGPAIVQDQRQAEQRRGPGGGDGGNRGGGRQGGGIRGGGGPGGGGPGGGIRGGDQGGPRVAVPRGSRPTPYGGRTIRPGGGNYYYPYAYSYYGPGYFYYDSLFWGNAGWGPGWGPGWRGGYYGGYPYGGGGYQGYDIGRLRLQVKPRDAEVFIDGYYAGQVDDFDGRLQGLSLETGGYSVEIRKAGWETLTFDVRVTPGRTTNYKGELIPQRQ